MYTESWGIEDRAPLFCGALCPNTMSSPHETGGILAYLSADGGKKKTFSEAYIVACYVVLFEDFRPPDLYTNSLYMPSSQCRY